VNQARIEGATGFHETEICAHPPLDLSWSRRMFRPGPDQRQRSTSRFRLSSTGQRLPNKSGSFRSQQISPQKDKSGCCICLAELR
jgi:hypothetical protein